MTRIILPEHLVESLDVAAALDRSLAHPPELLPWGTIEQAVSDHSEEAAAYLTEVLRSGLEVAGAEMMLARKAARGLRPVAVLSLPERVLLESLVGVVEPHLPPMRRTGADFQAFQTGPAEHVNDNGYVVFSDVSSFYDYVDHELLHSEIVAQTGETHAANALRDSLAALMGRRFGIPQGYRGADVLSEIVIDIVERRLLRRGLLVWRYADDFRIAADDWRSAERLIEVLTEELRAIGLHPNEAKTFPMGIARYRAWLEEPATIWAEINNEVQVDLRQVDVYLPEPADAGAVAQGAAVRALQEWREHAVAEEPGTGTERTTYRRLANIALAILRGLRSDEGLAFCRDLLQYEGWLSMAVGRYMGALAEEDPGPATETLGTLIADQGLYVSAWQALWLLEVPIRGGSTVGNVSDWVRQLMEAGSHPSLLRARAAHAMSAVGEGSVAGALRIFETVDQASAPEAVEAVVKLADDDDAQVLESVRRESPLFRWIVDRDIAPE